MSRYLHSRYQNLEAYTPGEQPRDRRYIKLNTNESPYPPSPEVRAAVTGEAMENLRLYSDPAGRELIAALAEHYALAPEQVFISNGSDDILNFAFMAFGEQGAAAPQIGYSFYPVFADLHGLALEKIPLGADFSVQASDYFDKNKLIVIANPNAPTGMALTRAEIRQILERNKDGVVLIDEAYVDFGAESAVSLLSDFPNLMVCMTFSKSRSLAGARLGFALASAELIADLNRLKFSTNPYNVNSLTLEIGKAALASDAYFRRNCQRIMQTRQETVYGLEEMGCLVLPSLANFVFTRYEGIAGARLYEKLKTRGILVRHFPKPRIADFIRVSIGTKEEMAAFVAAMGDILREEGL